MKKYNLFVLVALLVSLLVPLPAQASSQAMSAQAPAGSEMAAAGKPIHPASVLAATTSTLTRNGWPADAINGDQVTTSSIYGSTGIHIRTGTLPGTAGYAEYTFTLSQPRENITQLRVGYYGQDNSVASDSPDIRVYDWMLGTWTTFVMGRPEGEYYTPDLDPTHFVSASNKVTFQVFVDWSDTDSVHVKQVMTRFVYNRPPTVPVNPTPAEGAVNVPSDITLKWEGGDDPDGDAVYYWVYLDAALSGAVTLVPTCNGIMSKACTPPAPLLLNQDYVWKVVAADNPAMTNPVSGPEWHFKTEKPCYPLTRSHTTGGAPDGVGGNDPIAVPESSAYCDSGSYNEGAVISLVANPATGYEVLSWTGSDNDVSTAATNTITMPAAPATVTVNYGLSCYELTLTHTGQGLDPTAAPLNSVGCAAGEYNYAELITLTASPNAEWQVGSWTGTNNDGSTSVTNDLYMPARDTTSTANYMQTCRTLVLEHTGTGSNPVATPANSAGCSAGKYKAGQAITLSSTPGAGWKVSGWAGTNNDASTSTANSLTMPVLMPPWIPPYTTHTVQVFYIPVGGAAGTVNGTVNLQGRPAKPNNRWIVDLTITLTLSGGSTPTYTFASIPTDGNGLVTLNGINPGVYDFRVKGSHTLRRKTSSVNIVSGANTVNLGTLLEGDANNDNAVTAIDFSTLAGSYGKCSPAPGYNDTADFNEDACVTAADFSLLAANYGKTGQ